MNTYSTKASDIKREWHVIDASARILGQVATQAAKLLSGKHKPIYSPNLDTGDYVVVTNAARIRVTGNKLKAKLYYRHSGYPGGFKSTSLENVMAADPTRVIQHAVKGMLPHNILGRAMLRKLRVFPGEAPPELGQIKRKARPAEKAPESS